MQNYINYIVLQWNTMQIVTVKFQEDILERIDTAIAKNNFNSRTEFIREAVRDKLQEITEEQAIKGFLALYGTSKVRHTDKDDERIREKVGKEIMAYVQAHDPNATL